MRVGLWECGRRGLEGGNRSWCRGWRDGRRMALVV